jgi:hypothetical protein
MLQTLINPMAAIRNRYWCYILTHLSYTLIIGLTLATSITSGWAQTLQDKIAFANRDINGMWSRQFQSLGRTWKVPRTIGYVGRLRTPCGVLNIALATTRFILAICF